MEYATYQTTDLDFCVKHIKLDSVYIIVHPCTAAPALLNDYQRFQLAEEEDEHSWLEVARALMAQGKEGRNASEVLERLRRAAEITALQQRHNTRCRCGVFFSPCSAAHAPICSATTTTARLARPVPTTTSRRRWTAHYTSRRHESTRAIASSRRRC
jgi:hypothetical protein